MISAHGLFVDLAVAVVLSLPWLIVPMIAVRRQRQSVSLDAYPEAATGTPSRVSVILPARNEAAHVAPCIATLRGTTWPDVEIIVVDDHSTDETHALALSAADADPRVHIVRAPALPDGWFGKQWACHSGMQHATGEMLLFTDADTRHAPDLVGRLANARAARAVDLLSVTGAQEMNSFWERAVQPAVFAILLARFGGTRQLENATRPVDVIANGQCFMITRDAYDAVGGHAAVRDTVAEDLMLAQRTREAGYRVSLVLGPQQLSTHMYDGLRALVRGWMKNVYAGGRLSMRGGFVGRLLFPLALVGGPLLLIAPFLVAGAVPFFAVPRAVLIWSVISCCSLLWFFDAINVFARTQRWRVIFVPLGVLVFAAIGAAAVWRGQLVEWKGRRYRAA